MDQLKLSEKELGVLYRDLFFNSPIRMIISRADDGLIVHVSDATLGDSLFLSAPELIGHTTVEVGVWKKEEERAEFVDRVREQGSYFRRVDYEDSQGNQHTHFRFSKILTIQGTECLAAIAIQADDLRHTEERLRATAARLENAQDIARIGDYVFDPTSRLLTGSTGFYQILGLSPKENNISIDKAFANVHNNDRELVDKHFLVSGHPDGFRFEVRVQIDEDTRLVTLTGGSTAGHGERRLGVVQDTTEQHEREAERQRVMLGLQEAQKLESLGLLAGGVAHDFNNLLSGIMGNADLALMDLDQPGVTRARLEDILLASKSAADLAHQLLAYSGKGRFVVRVLDLSSLVREMSQLLEVSTTGKAVLQYNLLAGLPNVEGDETQLRQVVMNMILNAVEAVEAVDEHDGRVTVSTGMQYCDQSYLDSRWAKFEIDPGEYVYVEVSDNGSGMSEDTRARLFEPFFTTKFTGRGLGMSAVHGIVNGHSGAVILYSEPGKGTTFKVLLPACDAKATDIDTESEVHYRHGNSRVILVIDDDAGVRETVRRVLERHGYSVLVASDGIEGIKLFEKQADKLSLVLVDLTMPGIDGSEVFRLMRDIKPDVRTVLMSGYNEQDATQRFVGKGLAGFLPKPFMVDDLMGKVEEVIGEKK